MIWSEANLLRRLKANDNAALELVVERYYEAVFRQLWHLCNDRDVAADLTQETFAQACKALEGFVGQSSIRTWLYTIAVRAWYRWKEDPANQHRHQPLEVWAEVVPDQEIGPAQIAENRARRRAVQHALHNLPSPYRETLVLFYVQNFKYREISEVLDVSIGTVKSRLHEGLKRLKAALADEHLEENEPSTGDKSCEIHKLKAI